MADVTVNDLAKTVGTSVDRLLGQMKNAGLSHTSASEYVSDEEKKVLLASLKASQGMSEVQPKKITLKRKTTSTLRAGSGSTRKTVNVEVRKKRTYIKRDGVGAEMPVPPSSDQETVETVSPPALKQKSELVDDAEQKRQAALEARRNVEEEKARLEKLKNERESKEIEKSTSNSQNKSVDDVTTNKEEDRTKQSKKKAKHREDVEEPSKKAKNPRKGIGTKKSSHKIDITRLNEDYEEEEVVRLKSPRAARANQHGFKKPTEKVIHTVEIVEGMRVIDLANKMNVKANLLVKELIKLGVMATLNEHLDQETAQLVVEELGHKAILVSSNAVEEKLQKDTFTEGDLVQRAPVVTVMGHVDHGKTSLLDYIRNAKVATGEAGGITQHIGAYRVTTNLGEITFLDTPGHAAFTAMRARGALCTDVVVLVVAADDGVMPQTEEAIQHAKAAKVPVVVAINKCDKEAADPERVKSELAARDVIPDDWGGDVQFVEVSAHTGEGIDKLLDAIVLQSDLLELRAVQHSTAKGVVIESRVDRGRGVITTLLVQSGTLQYGDILLAGQSYGRVRAMTNEFGKKISESGPSTPVEVLGLESPPNAGDEFLVVPDERRAREVAEHRGERERQDRIQRQQAVNLENIFANYGENESKVLSVVVKADVRGSLEAIQAALNEIGNNEAKINIISSGVGGITGNDVNLALTSKAIIIGFNVRTESPARKIAEKEGVEIRYYSVIYHLLDEVKGALEGMLDPERVEKILGVAEVRDVFRSPKFNQVAGCIIVEGTVYRNKPIRVLRDNVVIFEGELESLRRFKDDVSEVKSGTECGIGVKDYNVKIGDQIEVFDVQEVQRKL